MGRKRRDLSDMSRNGEDEKKVEKYTESTRSLSDEVFADGLNSLNCATILVNCLASIGNQVRELFALHEQTKHVQIKRQELLDFLSNKFDDLEREQKKKMKK